MTGFATVFPAGEQAPNARPSEDNGTRVFPLTHPSAKLQNDSEGRRRSTRNEIVSFNEAFGALGVPMVLTLLTCSAWTMWLIVVAVAPNHTANWLMGTEAYDNGQFWLINDKTPEITLAGAAVVDICYLCVVAKMLKWKERLNEATSFYHLNAWVDEGHHSVVCTRFSWKSMIATYRWCRHFYAELTSFAGTKRKFWVRNNVS